MILSKETGMRIKRLMAEKKLSVREVQERLGLESPQSVYKWLHGTSLPALDNLLALSRLLGVRMEEILVCSEACTYPRWIRDGGLEALKEQEGHRIEEQAKVRRRQGRPTGLSDFSDLQTVLCWELRARLVERARQAALRPGRKTACKADLLCGGRAVDDAHARGERMWKDIIIERTGCRRIWKEQKKG